MGGGGKAPEPDPLRKQAAGFFGPAGGVTAQQLAGIMQAPDYYSTAFHAPLKFYRDLPTSAPITASRDALMMQVQDPTKFTHPLFAQQREELGANLVEQGRRMGGLYSTGTGDLYSQGMSDFTNQYLANTFQRQAGAAQALYGQQLGLGQAMFTPYQAFTGSLMGLYGGGGGGTPGLAGDNTWGQVAGAGATALGAYLAWAGPTAATAAPVAAASDRNIKHTVTQIGDDEVLSRFRTMPVYEWSYLGETARHMGPMAQDFRAAFGLGQNDREIFLLDAIGVLMGSVQALAKKVEQLETRDGLVG